MMAPATPRKPRNARNRGQPRASDYDSDHHPPHQHAATTTSQAGPSTPAAAGHSTPAAAVPSTPAAAAVPIARPEPGGHDAIGELNHRVLLRYVPTMQSYDRSAFSATVYKHDGHSWSEADIKGPMFICNLPPRPPTATAQPTPRSCVFIMNRLNLNNLVIDLDTVYECDLEDDLIMFTSPSASESAESVDIWGIYVSDSPEAMQACWSAIQSGWKAAKGIGQ